MIVKLKRKELEIAMQALNTLEADYAKLYDDCPSTSEYIQTKAQLEVNLADCQKLLHRFEKAYDKKGDA